MESGAILSRNWITLLRLMVNMRMARQMVSSPLTSINAEAYMALEDRLCHTIRDIDCHIH